MKNLKKFFAAFISVLLIPGAVCISQTQGGKSPDDEKIQKAKEYFSSGKELLNQGNYPAANEAFKNAQKLLEGVSSVPAAALEEKKPAVSGGRLQSFLKNAQEADTKGDYKTAIAGYRDASEYSPRNADICFNIAVELLKMNQFNEAAQAFKSVIQLNPRDKESYYNLGILYDKYLDDKKQALEYYRRYISLAPLADDLELVKSLAANIENQSGQK